jgi:hypothetical protein
VPDLEHGIGRQVLELGVDLFQRLLLVAQLCFRCYSLVSELLFHALVSELFAE